jgi:GT2 family glycosyltransferase
MKISAVILSFNSNRTLGRCIDQISSALLEFGLGSEVFVVDNGSTDGSIETIELLVKKHGKLLKPILFDKNTGTTFSRNAALKRATGDYIIVLDSDAYVSNDSLKILVDYLEENPDTGLVTPRLIFEDGRFQLSCDEFPTIVRKIQRFFFLRRIESRSHPMETLIEPTDVDYAISACWMIRRNAFERVGLFDEGIFYSPEDVDYCIRMWSAGYKVTYVPSAEVIHDAQELSRGFKLSKFHFSHLKGLFYLFNKHKYIFALSRLYDRINRHAI